MAALGSLALAASGAHGQILAGPLTNPGNGHLYYLLSQTNWTASERQAVALGGHLATVRNASEENWIYSTFNSYGGLRRALWIGLYDTDTNVNSPDRATRRLEFAWVSGEPVTYSNWSPYEPDNPSSGDGAVPPAWEYYVHIWDADDPYASTWNNYSDSTNIFSYPLNGVVEILPSILAITNIAPGQVQLSWPLAAASYALQRTPALQPASWQNVPDAPTTNGPRLNLTLPATNTASFYRLH